MKCIDVNNRMLSYLDGELTEQDRSAFLYHVDGCPQCAAQLEKIRNIYIEIDRERQEFEPNPHLAGAVISRISGNSATNQNLRIRYGRTLVSVASVAALLIGFILGTSLHANLGSNQDLVDIQMEQLADLYYSGADENPYLLQIDEPDNTISHESH